MNISFKPRHGALLALCLSLLAPITTHAFQSYSSGMTGRYYNPDTNDAYTFRSNGTYTFSAGPAKRAGGNISHSGTWKLSSYWRGPADTSGATLNLRARTRVVMEGRRRKTLRAARTFKLKMAFPEVEDVIVISGARFVKPGAENNG